MTEPKPNPYAVPIAEAESAPVEVDFAQVIRQWEHLRFIYNGVLVFFTVALTLPVYFHRFGELRYWVLLIGGAIAANLCYFAGPTIEGYGRFFRIWRPMFTKALFITGTIFASLLAVLAVVTYE